MNAQAEAADDLKAGRPGITPFDFEATFRAQYERIARVIARVVNDRARAEELAVEVFLKLWKNPPDQGGNVEGWLYRAAVRMGLDELRRRTRRERYERLLGMARSVVVCVCLLAFPRIWSAASMRVLKDGQPAPNFNLRDSTGAELRLADYKGKAVLLNFWATWCRPCKVEVPMLMEFENRYKANGLAVIGISMDDDGWKPVMPYIAKNKLNYPVVIGNRELAKRYGAESLPMTMLIDRDGRLAGVHLGLVEEKTWESEIGRLLAK